VQEEVMTTIRQHTIARGKVLADAFQDEGFETEGLEPGDDSQDYVLYVYRSPRVDAQGYTTRLATLHLKPDGRIHVTHGLNNVKQVLNRVGLSEFVTISHKPEFPAHPPRPLISETNTPAAERLVRAAAAGRFGRRRKDVFFEHDQWFVRMWNRAEERDETWSVVDTNRGVGFEQIE
jgi:hypothetical protein